MSCSEYASQDDVQAIRSSMSLGNITQGSWGEMIAAQIAVAEDKLDLIAQPYSPGHKGIDAVCRDHKGNLVVVEVKMTGAGLGSLDRTQHGRQGSVEWIGRQAELMQRDSVNTHNAKVGNEILSKGPENVRSITISVDPDTGVARAYERESDGHWSGIGQWDTREEGERL